MPVTAQILGDSPVGLWGLSAQTRLQRQLRSAGIADADAGNGDPDAQVLLVRAEYLFEVRTLKLLLKHRDVLLVCARDGGRAAALCRAADVPAMAAALQDASVAPPPGVQVISPASLATFDAALRRAEEPLLEPLSPERALVLEAQLYGNSYKGITDLVTKWLWPRPAKHIVHWCALRAITPNMVTFVGFLLMLAACVLFYYGQFWTGLAAGWAMTLLDTVDGKLARVTVQSSRFGHYFDHIIDLVHPPIWYFCWAEAFPELAFPGDIGHLAIYAMILGGYLVGRIAEGLFHLVADCSVFSWRPFDAWFRTITARRNPSLIMLTAALLLQVPEWGVYAIALWTVITTVILTARVCWGIFLSLRDGRRLESWLADPVLQQRYAKTYRTFANTVGAYVPG